LTPFLAGAHRIVSYRRHWLHFDAKYRLEAIEVSQLFIAPDEHGDELGENGGEDEEELARIYRQDDLFKMHTCRDGILSSRSAYILFPGHGTDAKLDLERKRLFVRQSIGLWWQARIHISERRRF
jgi:uncharacterized protein